MSYLFLLAYRRHRYVLSAGVRTNSLTSDLQDLYTSSNEGSSSSITGTMISAPLEAPRLVTNRSPLSDTLLSNEEKEPVDDTSHSSPSLNEPGRIIEEVL